MFLVQNRSSQIAKCYRCAGDFLVCTFDHLNFLPVPSPKSTVKTVKVSGTQEMILQFLHDNENITYEEIAEKMGVSRATVGRHISILKKIGILKRVGEDKNGHWIIVTP